MYVGRYLYMYTDICTTHMYDCMHVHMCNVHVAMYVRPYLHIFVCIYMYVCMYVCTCMYIMYVHMYVCMYVCVCM